MPETIEQRLDHLFLAEEAVPVVVVEVGGDDGGLPAVAFFHQLEEDVGLLRLQVQVPHLVNDQQVDAGEAVQQLSGRPVREACVHLVEQVLRLDEQAAVPSLERLEQDPDAQAGLPDASVANQDEVAGPVHEVQPGELLDDLALDARLAVPGEGLQRPGLWKLGPTDAMGQEAGLLRLVLSAQQRS